MTDASGLPPGLDGRVAIVTGAGRMRSIGRAIAVELARAGCDVVVTGSGRPAHLRPVEEVEAGWQDVESVADEVRGLGRRALSASWTSRTPTRSRRSPIVSCASSAGSTSW